MASILQFLPLPGPSPASSMVSQGRNFLISSQAKGSTQHWATLISHSEAVHLCAWVFTKTCDLVQMSPLASTLEVFPECWLSKVLSACVSKQNNKQTKLLHLTWKHPNSPWLKVWFSDSHCFALHLIKTLRFSWGSESDEKEKQSSERISEDSVRISSQYNAAHQQRQERGLLEHGEPSARKASSLLCTVVKQKPYGWRGKKHPKQTNNNNKTIW